MQDVITGGTGTDKLVVVDTTSASAAGLAGATITGVEALEVTANAGVGAFVKTGSAAVAGTAQTATITYSASTAATASIVIGGVTYTTAAATADTSGSDVADKIVALVNSVLGGTAAVKSGTGPSVVTITSPFAGTPLPTLSVSGAGGTTALGVVAGASSVEKVLATGAQAQIVAFTLTGTGHATDNTYTIYIDGINRGTIPTSATTVTDAGKAIAAAAIAAEINKVLPNAASATGSVINVTAPVAGTSLPIISVIAGGTTPAAAVRTEARANADAVVADTAAVVYNAAGFADAFTASGAGDMNVKAAATAAVKLTNTSGKIVVDTAKTVDIVTTGTGTTDVTGKALTTVSVKGGGVATVDNLENTTAATTALGKTLTAVTLNGIAGATAGVKGAALESVTLSTQRTALAVTVTNDTSTALTVNADAVGYTAAGADVTVSVAAGSTAKALTVNAASKSQLTVSGAALETLAVAGAGAAKINGLSSVALKSITSTNTAGVTLGALNAATRTVTGGDGKDSFTAAATLTQTVDTGLGEDSVSLNSATAAGSSIKLGGGNDKLLNAGSGTITTGANSTTGLTSTIDGGDGTDTVAASLLTVGTSALIKGFETLGLDLVTNGTSFDTEILAGTTGLEMLKQAAGTDVVTYTNALLSQSLSIKADTAATGSTVLTFKTGTTSGTADAYSVTFAAEGAATSTATAPTSIAAGTLRIEGVENINITSGQAANFVNNSIKLTDATMKTVVLTGAATTTTLAFAGTNGTNATAGGGAVNLIDGSALTGSLVVDLTGLTVDNGALGLTVKGGSGKDEITTANITSAVFGGAGADTFIVASNAGVLPTVTIGDLASGDKIDLAGTIAAAGNLGTAVNVSAATSLATALEIANGSAGTSATSILYWFQFAGNTYLMSDLPTAGPVSGNVDSTDNIVKITGLVDLTGSAFTTAAVVTVV